MSELFRLNSNDFLRGAVTAVCAAIFMTVASVVGQPGFDLFTLDYASLLNTAINAGVAAFVGYLSKNLLTGSDGKINLGVVKF